MSRSGEKGMARPPSSPVSPRRGAVDALLLVPTLQGGGAERVMVTLANRFDPARVRATLGVLDMRDAVYRRSLREGVEVVDLGRPRVRHALPGIIRLVRARRPSVVLSTLGHLNLGLALVRGAFPAGTRVIGRETTVVSENIAAMGAPRRWRALYRALYPRLDRVICQSREMQRDLVERFGIRPDLTVLIHNPVDAEAIGRAVAGAPAGRDQRPDGVTRLIAAGRLVPEKGFDLLIDALALSGDPSLRLTVLGEGPDAVALQDRAARRGVAGQVEFAGFVADPYPRFAAADAFVLSSRVEGFPNVVLEALACGTPVIACPAPGGTREILDGIPECQLAAEVSAPALAAAIADWRTRRPGRVAPSAVERYAVDVIVRRYEDLLRDAA